MSCSLCHLQSGHKPKCPHADRRYSADWSTVSVWEQLANEMFDEWKNDSIHETNETTRDFFAYMRRLLDDGNAFEALELIKEYRNIVKTDGRA